MTGGGDAAVAGATMRAADLVIFDFDGPITRLLPDPEYLELAAATIRLVRDAGVEVPPEIAALTDHGAVIVEVGRRWPEVLARVEAVSDAAEIAAAGLRDPAPGAVDLLRALAAAGTPVALVSNNGAACVHAFMDRFGLGAWAGQSPRQRTAPGTRSGGHRATRSARGPLVSHVFGRVSGRADRLKPSPAMLLDAAVAAGVPASAAVMVGDSVTDVEAAAAAGMPGIGLTPDADRSRAMREAGAVAVLPDTAALGQAYAAA